MSYICDICIYETNDKFNYNKHLSTKKHQEKANKTIKICKEAGDSDEDPSSEQTFKCIYCGHNYTTAGNLTRHQTTCIDRKQLIDNYGKQIQEITNKLNIVIKSKNKELKSKDETIATLKSENNNLKMMVNNTNSLAKTSVSALSYVAKHYNKAPAIEPIKNMALLHCDYSNDKFVEQLMYEKKHKTLVSFIGDLIVDVYKKEDSATQSIWASDISRLTYILRDMVSGKVDWVVDKKGIKTTKYIIQPILNYINKCALKYISDTDPRHTGLTTEQAVAKAIQLNKAMEISNMIDDKVLIDDLLKYMAPHFHVNKEKQLS